MVNLTPNQILAAARYLACERAPYFRTGILHMVFREAPGLGKVGTAGFAASKNWVVLWDPKSVLKHGVEGTAALIIHELGHLLRDHHTRFAAIPLANLFLANVAGDLTINPGLKMMGFKPPERLLYPKMFELPEGKTAEEYYELLQKKADQIQISSPECGSCSGGQPAPGEPQEDDPDARSEAESRRAVLETAKEIQKQGRGRVPADLLRIVDEILAPPKINWREQLRRILRGVLAYRPGSNLATFGKPSRRQAGLGFGSGCPILPSFRAMDMRVTVLIDTSGSMSKEQVFAGMSEVQSIVQVAGAAIDFIVCDAQVHAAKKVRNAQEACGLLRGGGGSNFCPAFEEIQKRRPKTQIVVAMTDGDITVPETEPSGMRVIWVLIGARVRKPCGWGTSIHLDDII